MSKVTDSSLGDEPYIKLCRCAACDETFQKDSCDITEIARAVATHWNTTHNDILENSYTAYSETQTRRRELATGGYEVQAQPQYLTVYDIITPDDSDSIFDPAFVDNVLRNEFCEDCLTAAKHLEDPIELDDEDATPITKLLCRDCKHDRKITRRRENNKQLTAFERV